MTSPVEENIHSELTPAAATSLPPAGLGNNEEAGSTYGSLDANDHRRLSFISFADVVHAEHAEASRDNTLNASVSSLMNRSPSPVRAPVSSHAPPPSLPTGGVPSVKSLDLGPPFGGIDAKLPANSAPLDRGAAASPVASSSATGGGEGLVVQTMRDVVDQTASGDLGVGSGTRSPPPLSASTAASQEHVKLRESSSR